MGDETESGDNTNFAIPEIVISPLAKGNAYASSVEMSHSSDVKTMEEIFGLSFLNNPIPTAETKASGVGYNNVASVNDLGDLFIGGVVPQVPDVSVQLNSQASRFKATFSHEVSQMVLIKNEGTTTIPGPIFLALDNLSANGNLLNADGATTVLAPLGSPYIEVSFGGEGESGGLRPHQTAPVKLEFQDSTDAPITFSTRLLHPVDPATVTFLTGTHETSALARARFVFFWVNETCVMKIPPPPLRQLVANS